MEILIFSFLIFSLLASLLAFDSKDIFGLLSIFAIFTFIFVYLWEVDITTVAQDLPSYYLWYQEVDLRIIQDGNDRLFSLLLSILPDHLDIKTFSFYLISMLLIPLFILLLRIKSTYRLNWEYLSLIALIILADRLFFDLALNTSRSSIAIIFLCIALTSNNILFKIFMAAIAFGIHMYATIFIVFIYFIYYLFRPSQKFLYLLGTISISIFIAKFIFNFSFLNESIQILNAPERLSRGVDVTNFELTNSLFIQIFLAIIAPFIFNILNFYNKLDFRSSPKTQVNSELMELNSIGIVFCSFVMLFFPELILSLRFAIIPIILLLPLIHINFLRILAITKSMIMILLLI